MIAVPNYIAPDEYLALELQSHIRHEYRRGLVYAMAGGTDNHDRIAFNLLKIIDNHLGSDSNCRFYSGNVKVNYQDEFYYCPDAFVTCDPRNRRDRYVKRYSKLVVEVPSSSTEAFDQDEKFQDYQQLNSLQEYVLIDQDQQVECRRRSASGDWHGEIYQVGDWIMLTSLDLEFDIAELYRGLDED
ncbi:MAG: Uma2 family endonuclease [Nodosilinea sp.]